MKSQKPLGMKWYKFLIYFALIAGAVVNILYSFSYLTGSMYVTETNGAVTAEEVYAYYGEGLQVADIAYGIFLIGFGVFAIILRHKLANYEQDAPVFVYIFYSILAGAPIAYNCIVAAITVQLGIVYNAIPSFIAGLVLLLCNVRYFKRREHLFGTSV